MSSSRVDVGRTAIGQALLLVTPLQMATVAQTIGNGGVRMEPRLVEKVDRPRRPHGRRAAAQGGRARHVARERRQGGDDDEVRRARGLGHRGRAARASSWRARPARPRSTSRSGINDLWFIGFTGKVAVAVIIDREQGQGGTVAAPIAKRVLQALGQ